MGFFQQIIDFLASIVSLAVRAVTGLVNGLMLLFNVVTKGATMLSGFEYISSIVAVALGLGVAVLVVKGVRG